MNIVSVKTLVAAALIGGGFCARAEQSPVSASPFVPQNSAQAAGAAPTENAPLELRGIVSTKSGYLYGLYDPSKRQSVWVRKNDPGAEFVVRSHDVGNETVNVEYQGRTMTLALKAAKIESMPNVPNPAAVAGPRGPNMVNGQPQVPQPPQMNPSAAQEAARLEAVAAEVRRRRMLRQAAVQNGQPQPQQAAPPMPVQGGQPGAAPQPR